MSRRQMGQGSNARVRVGRDPVGSPAGGGCCGFAVLAILAGLAGTTAGLVYASHAALGIL
jgi:hypothetical protein